MQFEKGKFIIVTELTEKLLVSTPYFHSSFAKSGVYQLYYRMCCDNFLTCGHAGKSVYLPRLARRNPLLAAFSS